MRLFLIRHGETEHNVAGLLAGSTDSILTNHGMLQTQRLAKYLTTNRKLHFTSIFSSDLQRAYMTAEELHKAQKSEWKEEYQVSQVVQLKILQEQDFGSLELVSWSSRHADDSDIGTTTSRVHEDFRPKETASAMAGRARTFVEDFVQPLLSIETDSEQECVAVISHGLFLASLWRVLTAKFQRLPLDPSYASDRLPFWTNTGYLELEVKSTQHPRLDSEQQQLADGTSADRRTPPGTIKILVINGKEHLANLKRSRAVGSATFDAKQKNIDGFFKRKRQETQNES